MISPDIRHEIAKASFCSIGDGIPWTEFLARKQLTVGFIGGSVTDGYIAGGHHENPYPALFCQQLRDQGYNVKKVVLSAPGMDSMMGNMTVDAVILPHKPDLVFLEFAINETTLRHSVLSFESLLRKLLTQPDPPIVALLLLQSASGYSCDSFMMPMAEHYGLPVVNFHHGVTAPLKDGRLVWNDYADMESHPTEEGHLLLADCLSELITQAKSAPSMPRKPLPEPWLDAPFAALRHLKPEETGQAPEMLVSRYNWAFPQAWQLSEEHPRLSLTLRCKAMVLVYEVHHLPEYGSCRVFLDGKPLKNSYLLKDDRLHGDSVYGWGGPMYLIALQSDTIAEHTLTLEWVEKHFFLMAIGFC